jgi:hypothetical protein
MFIAQGMSNSASYYASEEGYIGVIERSQSDKVDTYGSGVEFLHASLAPHFLTTRLIFRPAKLATIHPLRVSSYHSCSQKTEKFLFVEPGSSFLTVVRFSVYIPQ